MTRPPDHAAWARLVDPARRLARRLAEAPAPMLRLTEAERSLANLEPDLTNLLASPFDAMPRAAATAVRQEGAEFVAPSRRIERGHGDAPPFAGARHEPARARAGATTAGRPGPAAAPAEGPRPRRPAIPAEPAPGRADYPVLPASPATAAKRPADRPPVPPGAQTRGVARASAAAGLPPRRPETPGDPRHDLGWSASPLHREASRHAEPPPAHAIADVVGTGSGPPPETVAVARDMAPSDPTLAGSGFARLALLLDELDRGRRTPGVVPVGPRVDRAQPVPQAPGSGRDDGPPVVTGRGEPDALPSAATRQVAPAIPSPADAWMLDPFARAADGGEPDATVAAVRRALVDDLVRRGVDTT